MSNGKIYLLKAIGDEDTFYKIGKTSRSAQHRADELDKNQALTVSVLAEYNSDIYDMLETVVLKRFSHNKKKGEWFTFPDGIDADVFNTICKMCEDNLKLFDINYLKKIR